MVVFKFFSVCWVMGAEGRLSGGACDAVAAHETADGAVSAEAVKTVAEVRVIVVELSYLGCSGLVSAAEEFQVFLLTCDDTLPLLVYLAGILELCGCLLLGDEKKGDESSRTCKGSYELYDEVWGHRIVIKKKSRSCFDTGAGLAGKV